MEKIKILIVDDNEILREGIAGLVRRNIGYQVYEAYSINSAISTALEHEPDIVLLPCTLADGRGLEIVETLRHRLPAARCIYLAQHNTQEGLQEALQTGIKGYLLKSITAKELLDAIVRVAQGENVIDPSMVSSLIDIVSAALTQSPRPVSSAVEYHRPAQHKELDQLTSREMEVFGYLCRGASNQEIANQLFLSENTVKNHVHNILAKLKLVNRRAAMMYVSQPKHNGTYQAVAGLTPSRV